MLAKLAAKQAVVCSVHQPSARALALVAHIGLLSPSGRTLYFGRADKAPAHFEGAGYPLPPLTNAAEHYLEVVADAEDADAQQALLKAYTEGLERQARAGTDVTAALLKLEPSAPERRRYMRSVAHWLRWDAPPGEEDAASGAIRELSVRL